MAQHRSEAGTAVGKMPSSSHDEGKTDQPTSASNAVTLISMDGDGFVVDASALVASELFKNMVDGSSGDEPKEIPLPNMHSNVVAKVVEFCQHHEADPMSEIPKPIQHGETVSDHVQEWYAAFVAELDNEMLFEVLLAANYLDLKPLLELCAATVGLRIINKTPDEVRQEFNITEAFSPDVERKLREENKWSTEPPVRR